MDTTTKEICLVPESPLFCGVLGKKSSYPNCIKIRVGFWCR